MSNFNLSDFFNPGKLWKRENKNRLHSNRIFDTISWDSESPDKKIKGTFYGLETNDWVNVICFNNNEKLILVEQYRHGINQMSLELPGGICEFEGEDKLLRAAKAELTEECGYTSNDWKYLGKLSANPGILNNFSHTFLAKNAERTNKQNLDIHEMIEIHEISINEIPDLIQKGIFHHSLMVAALGLYFLCEKHIVK
ncbi:MAG: NUDIX hydrolase [Leptospiraceae bacterium]|nr:NUDIX hydrolase [Leptospiraceae bacterium]MCK6382370.1 NUDIX hydrolase [Leptospiraceae bacterium]NUM40710.1 NUDIX hydrolase [Leptospiraceae bacterium]